MCNRFDMDSFIHKQPQKSKSVVMFDKAELRCCETDGWEKST